MNRVEMRSDARLKLKDKIQTAKEIALEPRRRQIAAQKRWAWRPRDGTGLKPGIGKKTKISVSVDKTNWQTALSRWNDKSSQLVVRLVWRYIDTDGGILQPEALI